MNSAQKNLGVYLCLFSPIVLIVVQSFFKVDIVNVFPSSDQSWLVYWSIRVALLSLFGAMLFCLKNKALNLSPAPKSSEDVYGSVRRRLDPLLGLRSVACFMVLLGHWFFVAFSPSVPTSDPVEYTFRALLSASPWGGVWMFFSLSGYLMGKGFVTGRHNVSLTGMRRFYRNRILRIFPIYLSSIFLVSVFVHPAFLNVASTETLNVWFECLFMDLTGRGPVGALWSVSTEFQFYLLVPLLFMIASKLNKTSSYVFTAAVVVIVLSGYKYLFLNHWPHRWHANVYYPFLANLDSFIPGFLMSFIVQDMREKRFYMKYGLPVGFLLLGLMYLVISLWSYPEMVVFPGLPGSPTRIYYLAFAPGLISIFTALVIFFFEVSIRKKAGGNFFWKIQTFLGLLTYCLYVWHEPTYLSIRSIFPAAIDFSKAIVVFPFGMMLTFTMAMIFYCFIEKYYDKKKTALLVDEGAPAVKKVL